MTGAQIIVLATPVFLVLIALEYVVGHVRDRNTDRMNDTLGKPGWFDRWFCGPSNHRVHHAVNER